MSLAITPSSLHRLPDVLIKQIDSFVEDTSRLEETCKHFRRILKTDYIKNPTLAAIMGNKNIVKIKREDLETFKKELESLLNWLSPERLERIRSEGAAWTDVQITLKLARTVLILEPPANLIPIEQREPLEACVGGTINCCSERLRGSLIFLALTVGLGILSWRATRDEPLTPSEIFLLVVDLIGFCILFRTWVASSARRREQDRYLSKLPILLANYQQLARSTASFLSCKVKHLSIPPLAEGVSRPLANWFLGAYARLDERNFALRAVKVDRFDERKE